jgi:formate--tetrahydrofolate ligase
VSEPNTFSDPLSDVAAQLNIPQDALLRYARDKAKVDLDYVLNLPPRPDARLVLVTAISPTPAGEGKTTTSIGLADGLRRIGIDAVLALREPSMGPVFGIKGGATGGGLAELVPSDDINLHFTGDFAAISAAHNLLIAMLDNHMHHGAEPQLDPRAVNLRRALDVNDRALRDIVIGLGGRTGGIPRQTGFDITAACETMAVFCLATSLADLRARLGRMIVGRTMSGEPFTAEDLGAAGSMTALLRDALSPNLVRTLEGTPAFVHGGPFGNIAHGCNSVIATTAAMRLGSVAVTEAGFGADLGAEKFFDIKCRQAGLTPDLSVCVATIRALKYHGGMPRPDLETPNVAALKAGMVNLTRHVQNLQDVFGQNVVVALNAFASDTEEEAAAVIEAMAALGVEVVRATHFADGGAGAIALAETVRDRLSQPSELTFAYPSEATLRDKATAVATRVYGAAEVTYSPEAARELARLQDGGFGDFEVCIAKTQYSFSTDAKALGAPSGHTVHIRRVSVSAGAGFVVLISGDIMTMPGLSSRPAALGIDVSDDGQITGIF